MKIKWDEEKTELLRRHYPNSDWGEIFESIGSNNREAIVNKASKLRIKRTYEKICEHKPLLKNRTRFTQEEDLYMIEKYNQLTAREIAHNLNRKCFSITNRLKKLNIKKEAAWSEGDIQILREVYPIYPNKYIQKKFFPDKRIPTIVGMANTKEIWKTKEKGQEWYERDESLQKLKDFAQKLGRTPTCAEINENPEIPSTKTFDRYFGCLSKAIIACGFVPNAITFNKGIGAVSPRGEKCDSNSELIITEYLIKNNIDYKKEVRYSDYIEDDRCNTKTCDWVVGNIFIEYFGMPEKSQYYKKMETKRQILQDHNIELIELFRKDLNKLDQKLGTLSQ